MYMAKNELWNEKGIYILQAKQFIVFQTQGSKFIFGFGSTCATRGKFLGALPKF